jgi:hypothetical protein
MQEQLGSPDPHFPFKIFAASAVKSSQAKPVMIPLDGAGENGAATFAGEGAATGAGARAGAGAGSGAATGAGAGGAIGADEGATTGAVSVVGEPPPAGAAAEGVGSVGSEETQSPGTKLIENASIIPPCTPQLTKQLLAADPISSLSQEINGNLVTPSAQSR